MNITCRCLIAAALLATLAACGNKGPLVRASDAAAQSAPAAVDSPPPSDPANPLPVEEQTTPPATDPASPTPPDGGGNG